MRFRAWTRWASARYTPMEDDNNGWSVQVQGKPDPHLSASYLRANPDYFDSVGTRVVMGRGIRVTDTPRRDADRGGERDVCEEAVQAGRESDWAALWRRAEVCRRLGDCGSGGGYRVPGRDMDQPHDVFRPLMQRVPSDTDAHRQR